MAGTPKTIVDELPEMYHELERHHLVPRWEIAPAHRHSPAAIRFIIQGQAAYTTVEGDQCFMGPGDLVLTPPRT